MSTIEQAVEDILSEQDWTGKIFSDGWVDAPETIEVIEPATGEVLGTAGVANAASVAVATKSAASAQRGWAALPMADRVAVVSRAAELLERHRAEISGWMVRESGAIPPKVAQEIGASIGQLNEAASLISAPLEQELASPIPGRTSTARRAPIGVVGVITPWNFPIVLAMRSLGPALVLGNAVVLKSDPNTPVSGGVIVARIFEEAGLPSGVLHVFCGGSEIGQALVEDPNVRMISFTGSSSSAATARWSCSRTPTSRLRRRPARGARSCIRVRSAWR
jgi:benzaldehyde dehydrogenase (NAD)